MQAPADTGYGFGATVIVAGLMLTPFSATSFLAATVTVTAALKPRKNKLAVADFTDTGPIPTIG
jgi:hypothetical protein